MLPLTAEPNVKDINVSRSHEAAAFIIYEIIELTGLNMQANYEMKTARSDEGIFA